jgi:hypothetical protein
MNKLKSTKEGEQSWRDAALVEIHPACELIPPMSPEQVPELGADIKANGLNKPIVIIEKARHRADGTWHAKDPRVQVVLDGRSRLDAMEAVGIYVVNEQGQLDDLLFKRALGQVGRYLPDYLDVIDEEEIDPYAYVIAPTSTAATYIYPPSRSAS